MKKAILVILAILIGVAALAGAGFVGFQMGVRHTVAFQPREGKEFGPFHKFGNDGGGDFHHFGGPGFEKYGKDFRGHGFGHGNVYGGRGFISPFFVLVKLAFLGLIVWMGVQLFKGNGWQLTLARVQPPSVTPSEPTPPAKPKKGKQ